MEPWALDEDMPDNLCYRCWGELVGDEPEDLCKRCQGPAPEPIVRDIWELAEHLGAPMPGELFEVVYKRVGRMLYKYTDCGISFYIPDGGGSVVVAGYCEGTDRECEAHELTFPFFLADFNAAVEEADKDGCALWDETHGCEDCGTLDIDGTKDGEKPIDPECKNCGGLGEVC